jgi:multiple sugar transport system substrate-binding protein
MNLKRLGVLLCALILVFAMVGCSNDEKSSADGGKSEDGVVTLKFHHWYNNEAGNWEKVIAEFEKTHPKIKVESVPLVENLNHDEYLKKLDLLASSGEQLDVLMFSNHADFAKRVSAGLVAPLDSFIDKEGLNVEEEYNSPPSKIDGSYYGLPAKLVTNLVLLNKDHLDAAGLPVPTDWTWDEYQEYAKKLTKGEGASKQYGSYFHTWPDYFLVLKLLGKEDKTHIINEDGSSNMEDPLIKDSLKLRYTMEQEDGSSVPMAETLSQKLDYRQQFFSQSASMVPVGSWMVTEWGEFTPDFTMAWAPYPKNNKDDESYTIMQGDVMNIAQNSEHKEEAYEFIRWFTTEGLMVQQKSIPAWKNADLEQVVNDLVASTKNPDAVDKESLIYTLENSVPAKRGIPKGYITEVYDAYNAEAELYLLGEQDLDTTVKNAKKKVEEIIDANKE